MEGEKTLRQNPGGKNDIYVKRRVRHQRFDVKEAFTCNIIGKVVWNISKRRHCPEGTHRQNGLNDLSIDVARECLLNDETLVMWTLLGIDYIICFLRFCPNQMFLPSMES